MTGFTKQELAALRARAVEAGLFGSVRLDSADLILLVNAVERLGELMAKQTTTRGE